MEVGTYLHRHLGQGNCPPIAGSPHYSGVPGPCLPKTNLALRKEFAFDRVLASFHPPPSWALFCSILHSPVSNSLPAPLRSQEGPGAMVVQVRNQRNKAGQYLIRYSSTSSSNSIPCLVPGPELGPPVSSVDRSALTALPFSTWAHHPRPSTASRRDLHSTVHPTCFGASRLCGSQRI
jgi:hypothetical protein